MTSEPILVISGALGAVVNALNAFVLTFVRLSVTQTAAEAGLVAAVSALVLAFLSRRKATPV